MASGAGTASRRRPPRRAPKPAGRNPRAPCGVEETRTSDTCQKEASCRARPRRAVLLRDRHRPARAARVGVLVSLGGFIDAGHTQRLLTEHLLATLEHTVVASFDVDQLVDYRGRRPAMAFDRDRWFSYDDPCLVLHRARRPRRPPFLAARPAPSRTTSGSASSRRSGSSSVPSGSPSTVSVHGIPMAVPHTRPIGHDRARHRPAADRRATTTAVRHASQVPGSLAALLELRLGEAGHDALGFAVHVPHYLAQAEFADARAGGAERDHRRDRPRTCPSTTWPRGRAQPGRDRPRGGGLRRGHRRWSRRSSASTTRFIEGRQKPQPAGHRRQRAAHRPTRSAPSSSSSCASGPTSPSRTGGAAEAPHRMSRADGACGRRLRAPCGRVSLRPAAVAQTRA